MATANNIQNLACFSITHFRRNSVPCSDARGLSTFAIGAKSFLNQGARMTSRLDGLTEAVAVAVVVAARQESSASESYGRVISPNEVVLTLPSTSAFDAGESDRLEHPIAGVEFVQANVVESEADWAAENASSPEFHVFRNSGESALGGNGLHPALMRMAASCNNGSCHLRRFQTYEKLSHSWLNSRANG